MKKSTHLIKEAGSALATIWRSFTTPAVHPLRCLLTLCVVGCGAAVCSGAPPPSLSIQISAGYAQVTVTGTAGTAYELQYVDQLSAKNNWLYLINSQLAGPSHVFVDTSQLANSGQRFYLVVEIPNTNTVFIPAGTFTMGSPVTEVDRNANEGPQTVVTLTNGFFVGKYPVTQGEYLSLMGTNPSFFTGDLSRPVEQVSWFDATNYCGKLTAPAGWRYRLPTEAEWEYACRAGTTTRFYYGDDPGYVNLASHAWYTNNAGDQTHAVGQKPANPWGLNDMGGNVWDWCLDTAVTYPGGSVTNPVGPPYTGSAPYIAFRGGGWISIAPVCRSANRGLRAPELGSYRIGFRVVLVPSP